MGQFIFTCPFCKQQFAATDELIGTTSSCSNCGSSFIVQRQMNALTAPQSGNTGVLALGIISLLVWLIPVFSLPVPIIGFALAHNRNYRLGVILNSIGLGLSILWTFICIANELE